MNLAANVMKLSLKRMLITVIRL